MKQTRKIAVGILAMLVITMICTISQAFDVYREDAEGIIQEHKFYPNNKLGGGEGTTWFCIQPGGEFHVNSLMSKAENTEYPVGSYIPKNGTYQCVECAPIVLPWQNNQKYYYKYEQGETFSFYEYPDAAYVLAELYEKGKILSWDAAYGIWNSRLSKPIRIGDYPIIAESKAYDEFFRLIHGGYTSNDMFESLIKDKSGEIYKGVKQTDGSYVVGPFNIDYPIGVYDNQNKFSWIDSIEVITNTGTVEATILSEDGAQISINDLKENGSKTLNKQNFYVKFYSKTATEAVVKITFGYLEHCEATMTEYVGKRMYRNWEKEISETRCTKHGYFRNPGSGTVGQQGYVAPSDWNANLKDRIRYKAIDEEGSATQRLMALSGEAKKVKKKVSKYFPFEDKPVDLTMKLAGNVFLDHLQGKENEGNNKFDKNEGFGGIEVILYDESTGKPASGSYPIMHQHVGDSTKNGGCYTTPVYHTHLGNENAYGQCYSEMTHKHTGSTEYGTGCYRLAYHKHNSDCYAILKCTNTDTSHVHDGACYSSVTVTCGISDHTHGSGCGTLTCTQEHEHTLECYAQGTFTCQKTAHTHSSNCYSDGILVCGQENHKHGTACNGLICGKTAHTHVEACYNNGTLTCTQEEHAHIAGCYGIACGKVNHTHSSTCYGNRDKVTLICNYSEDESEGYKIVCGQEEKYKLTCTKTDKTIDRYDLSCNKTIEKDTDGTKEVVAKVLTDKNGYYEFKNLNAQKRYYVEFVYNGMLYTNVERLEGNDVNISKATEEAQGNKDNRRLFNTKFKEIGSNPKNYWSPSKQRYNEVFLQEDIADTFTTIAKNFGAHGDTQKEVFAYDCRIKAYSTEVYPINPQFTIDAINHKLAAEDFEAIYQAGGKYDQLHVNLGVIARPTFDLALYKDVMNATLTINGQKEVYTYDARKDWEGKGFSYGVNENYYLEALRNKYMENKDTGDLQKANAGTADQYIHEYRTEEIINGNNLNETYLNDWLGEEKYKETLYGNEGKDKNYSWRDINSGLTDPEKLNIEVTYKIAIRNQSSILGSVTEIVDYYDENYDFVRAYVGDEDGNEIANTRVDAETKSKYGTEDEIRKDKNTDKKWIVNTQQVEAGKRGYKTIYLRPTEKILYNGNRGDKEQYIFVTYRLISPEQTLINAGLPWGKTFYTYNLAEINGYKTYILESEYKENPIHKDENGKYKDPVEFINEIEQATEGLVDRDSIPGNFNPGAYEMGVTPLEDDTNKAPAYAYTIRKSRTIEGTVFEDANTGTASLEAHVVDVATKRFGNGTIGDKQDKGIAGVKVELVEIKEQLDEQGQKEEKLIVRSTTYTDENGWYGFGAFIPGQYTIRFTYGGDDQTALTTTSQYVQGKNDTSYNGQDYQSTKFTLNQIQSVSQKPYKTDDTLRSTYNTNNGVKNSEEQEVLVAETQKITKYEAPDYYWFEDEAMQGKSDATDDAVRREQVKAYAKSEYGKEIINHKAEVFNSYINQKTLREQEAEVGQPHFNKDLQAQPMEADVDTPEKNRALVDELERRNYMFAYTPEINIEIENTKKIIEGNQESDFYEYEVTGVDFGVVERPRSKVTIDQDIKHVKVTATDGTILLELEQDGNGNLVVKVNNGDNYQWQPFDNLLKKLKVLETQYEKDELLNIIMDDELLNGAKLEVTYNITVTNQSEESVEVKAKGIVNYVANNLNFDLVDNKTENGENLWEVVKKDDIQRQLYGTWINSQPQKNTDKRLIDLSTQTTVLKATDKNPITEKLKPGEYKTATLTLKKTLSAEHLNDDLSYTNLTEIVEIESTDGRYDHGAIPGNQSLEKQPREHDTSGASRYDDITGGGIRVPYKQDSTIIITPPTGETHIYYVLGTIVGAILLVGILIIRKLVVAKNKAKED